MIMTKDYKKLIDETEMLFSFLNKRQLKILKLQLRQIYFQGALDDLRQRIKIN